jgi:glutamine synthetase
MIRIPLGNEKSSRVEVRSVAPRRQSLSGALFHFQAPDRGETREDQESAPGPALPAGQHYTALELFRKSNWAPSFWAKT